MPTSTSCSIPCNLCSGRDVQQVGINDRDGGPLRTVICRQCGLVWTDPRPDHEAYRKFYAEEYRLQYKSVRVPKLKHVYRETLRAIERYQVLRPIIEPGMKLLDVGSGAGFFPYVLRSQGYDAKGIEPNQGFAGFANSTMGVPTTNAFLHDVEVAQESVNMVTMNHVLEHVEDPLESLQRAAEWLAPGGYLVVEVPNIEATYHAPANRFHIGHLYNFNSFTLERLGMKAGLSVLESILVSPARHVHVTFHKQARRPVMIDVNWAASGNYQRVADKLRGHSTLEHYTSPRPYARILQKQWEYLAEWRAVRGRVHPKQLVDALIATELPRRRNAA